MVRIVDVTRGWLAASLLLLLVLPGLAADEPAWKAKLDAKITLKVPDDSFDRITPLISEEIGMPIRIEGNDLRTEGITKTNRISVDLADTPVREVLNELARKVNTDKTAKGLDDEKQKLVYVIDSSKGAGKEEIVFTTREMAWKRGRPPEWFKIPESTKKAGKPGKK